MPETRQKLQLNGDAISLYLLVHPSGIAPASSPGSTVANVQLTRSLAHLPLSRAARMQLARAL